MIPRFQQYVLTLGQKESADPAISLVRPATAPKFLWRSLRIERILQWNLGFAR